MKEAKGGGRNAQEGIGGRKKSGGLQEVGPCSCLWFKTLLRALGLSGLDLLPLRDGSQQDQEEQ